MRSFNHARPGSLLVTFGSGERGELPLKRVEQKQACGVRPLNASMIEMANGVRLSIQADRCGTKAEVFKPLEERKEEIEDYRQCSCLFFRNGDPVSNFYRVEYQGDGVLWVRNESAHTLRFQMPDGQLYRVCAGYTEALVPENKEAQIAPIQVLLDLGGNILDFRINAAYVKYGEHPWRRADVESLGSSRIDSYICAICSGDDRLGMVESFSDYFLRAPRLRLLALDAYGPAEWYFRNRGEGALPLGLEDDTSVDIPADGQVYQLETLLEWRKETVT